MRLSEGRLTNQREEERLPHLVDVVLLLNLDDPDATIGRFLYKKRVSNVLTSHMGTSLSRKKKRSTSRGISLGFFMYTK